MFATSHTITGALIGYNVRNPGKAFLLGLASHLMMDAAPHYGVPQEGRPTFMEVAVPDGLTLLGVFALVATKAPTDRRASMLAGALGGLFFDLNKPSLKFFGRSCFPKSMDYYLGVIQDEHPSRLRWELTFASMSMMTLMLVLLKGKKTARG